MRDKYFIIITAAIALFTAGSSPFLSEERCIRTNSMPYTLGNKVILFHQFYAPVASGNYITFFNMHDNENTAVEAAKYVIARRGGRLVDLRHRNERTIVFSVDNKGFEFDPNRIYSSAGIYATLMYSNRAAFALTRDFALETLNYCYNTNLNLIVALHNNKMRNEFSLLTYMSNQELSSNADTVYLGNSYPISDFFYVNRKYYFDFLKSAGFNVILENRQTLKDDGSLAVYCNKYFINYINIETGFGRFDAQVNMINAVIDCINTLYPQ